MKLVVDANSLFAALLRDGLTRRIWFNPLLELYAPPFLVMELDKYKEMLVGRSSGSMDDFLALASSLLSKVSFVKDEEASPYFEASRALSNDPKDWI